MSPFGPPANEPPGEILLYRTDYEHFAWIFRRWPILGDFGVYWHHASAFCRFESPTHVGSYSSAATLCALTKNRNPICKTVDLRNLVGG